LKFLTYEYNLSEEIIFHGVLKDTEIVELLELSDVYIQYSLQEGFCNSLLEAQCMGCIAIASNVGGLPENVLDGFTGFLVESHRPDLLADLLTKITHLSDFELVEIRKNAISRIQNDFNLTKQGKEFLELFSS
jgi:colanic acid/amylovoran biosynthesis glycosyltransferase